MVNTDFFNEYGYQVFKSVLPLPLLEEVRTLLEADSVKSLSLAKAEIGYQDKFDAVSMINEIAGAGKEKLSQLTKFTHDTLCGHISLETRLSPALQKIPTHPNVLDIVRALLKSEEIFLHMPPTARFVLPGNPHAGVPPHQDVIYNRHMSNFVVVWVPLVDIDDDCGGVVVYENTGKLPEQPLSKGSSAFWQNGVDVSGYNPIHCKLLRGDILVLNRLVVHASMPNKSTRPRYSVDHRFFGKDELSTKHYLDLQTGLIVSPKVEANENI